MDGEVGCCGESVVNRSVLLVLTHEIDTIRGFRSHFEVACWNYVLVNQGFRYGDFIFYDSKMVKKVFY